MRLQTSYRVYSRYYQKIGPLFKKPRVQAYTMLILSLLTMSFFGIFAIKPTLKTIAQLQKKIADSRIVNEALEQKIIHLSQSKEEYKKIENDLPLISKALPKEPQFSFFLKDLESLTQAVGATISSVRLESIELTKKNSQSSTKISGSLKLLGDYSSCKDFLNRLLTSARIYTVDSFEIRPNLKEEPRAIKLDFNINAYYLISDVQ